MQVLGQNVCQKLGIIELTPLSKGTLTGEKALEEYGDVFSCLGIYQQEYDIRVRPRCHSIRSAIETRTIC